MYRLNKIDINKQACDMSACVSLSADSDKEPVSKTQTVLVSVSGRHYGGQSENEAHAYQSMLLD